MRWKSCRKLIIVATTYCLLFTVLLGCDAFVRKFTRKPKKENLPQEELVLVPQEYKSTLTKEELWRQYFLYWKSWQDELIGALGYSSNRKKPLGSANEALKNLEELKKMLNAEKQKKMDIYFNQLKDLRDEIVQDTYGANVSVQRMAAERIKRAILRDFSYNKIKDSLQ